MSLRNLCWALLFVPMAVGAMPPTPPEGAERVLSLDGAPNQFAITAEEDCCNAWILIRPGDTATGLRRLYGEALVPSDVQLQRDKWFSIDFANLDSQWRDAIRNKVTAGSRTADRPAAEDAQASPQEGPDNEHPSQTASPKTPSSEKWSLLIVVLLLNGVLLACLFLQLRALVNKLDGFLEVSGEAKGVDEERRRRHDKALAEEREKLTEALASVTKLESSVDLLHMAKEIAAVVATAGQESSSSETAHSWTIFTWRDRWKSLQEAQREGQAAKGLLQRTFGDIDMNYFVSMVAELLSILKLSKSDGSDIEGRPANHCALSELAGVASEVKKELAAHSGLSAEATVDSHLSKIREVLMGMSVLQFSKKTTQDLAQSILEAREGAEAKVQLAKLNSWVESVQELLAAERFRKGDLLQNIEDLMQERYQVREKLRELAGEDGSDSELEVISRVHKQLAGISLEAQESRSKVTKWADRWRRLASALGYRVVGSELDDQPGITAIKTTGVWWDLRLGLTIMLTNWEKNAAQVPQDVRDYLGLGEVHQKALEMINMLEDSDDSDVCGHEGGRVWDLLNQKTFAINGIVRAKEFLRAYYPSTPAFRHRLEIGASALEVAFTAVGARLVKVELLRREGADRLSFDEEHVDEDLRHLEGPRTKIPEHLKRAREGGFPVDMLACAVERNGVLVRRGRLILVSPGTWGNFLS